MKAIFKLACYFLAIIISINKVNGQQRLEPKKMTYVNTLRPNSIIYNDTIYNGSAQFKALFLRTDDKELVDLYRKHQSYKIWGNIVGVMGSAALGVGVVLASDKDRNHTAGWITAGAGLVGAITGSYMIMLGQKELLRATALFNKKYGSKPVAAIGMTDNGLGLTVNF